MTITAIYPGSFDPITNGHVNIIRRARTMYDRLILCVARNLSKSALFTIDERIALIRESFPDLPDLEIQTFDGLLVSHARDVGAGVIVRGLRAVADFEYEYQMANMNRRLEPGIETVFLMASPDNFYVSSRLVKEVAMLGGNVEGVVPEPVRLRLLERFPRNGS